MRRTVSIIKKATSLLMAATMVLTITPVTAVAEDVASAEVIEVSNEADSQAVQVSDEGASSADVDGGDVLPNADDGNSRSAFDASNEEAASEEGSVDEPAIAPQAGELALAPQADASTAGDAGDSPVTPQDSLTVPDSGATSGEKLSTRMFITNFERVRDSEDLLSYESDPATMQTVKNLLAGYAVRQLVQDSDGAITLTDEQQEYLTQETEIIVEPGMPIGYVGWMAKIPKTVEGPDGTKLELESLPDSLAAEAADSTKAYTAKRHIETRLPERVKKKNETKKSKKRLMSSEAVNSINRNQPDVSGATTASKKFACLSKDPEHKHQSEFYGRWHRNDESGHGLEKVRALAEAAGRTATIAVIDSGFRADHVEINGSLAANLAYDAYRDKDASIGPDKFDHGTGVASVLVGRKDNGVGGYGVCANTNIIPITAADPNGVFDEIDILKSLNHIYRLEREGRAGNLKVVVMSFGSWCDTATAARMHYGESGYDPTYTMMKFLHDRYGIVFVCAGGNGDGGFRMIDGAHYPSDYLDTDADEWCVSVTSCDSLAINSIFSDLNPHKDLTAIGEDVLVASAAGPMKTDYVDGTSYSAPIVAGAISSLLQINPKLTPVQAVKLLKDTAVPIVKYWENNYLPNNGSKGVINAELAAWKAVNMRGGGTMPKLVKAKSYWKGMTDWDRNVKSRKFGYTVLTACSKPYTTSKKNYKKNAHKLAKLSDGRVYKIGTVALSSSDYTKNIKNLKIPERVKLGDGRVYKVVQLGDFWARFEEQLDSITIPKSVKMLGTQSLASFMGYAAKKTVLKTPNLKVLNKKKKLSLKKSKNRVKACFENCRCWNHLGRNRKHVTPKVIVKVSSKKKTNKKYLKWYKQIFAELNSGMKVKLALK